VGRPGAGILPPQPLGATCQYLGTSEGLTNSPLCAAKPLAVCCASHQVFMHGEARKNGSCEGQVGLWRGLMGSPREVPKRWWGE